jgi:hypothetical protein
LFVCRPDPDFHFPIHHLAPRLNASDEFGAAAAATLVCLTDCHVRFTPPSGRVEDVHLEAGQTRWI